MGLASCICLLLTFFTYVRSDIVLLTQPASVTKKPGESHKLSCSVSGFSLDSYYVSWVKQIPGKGLEWLLAYRKPSDTIYYATGVEGRIVPSRGSTTTYITINNLRADDTAMYYCARGVRPGGSDYWGQGTMVTVTAVTPSSPTLYGLLSSCEQPNTDGSVTYGCLAMNYSPEITTLSWRKEDQPIATGIKTYPSVLTQKGTYTMSSQLTIPESEVGSSKIYCEVRHDGSDWEKEMPDRVVHHPTLILTVSSSEEITRSRSATIVCSIIDFRPKSMTVNWLKNGKPTDLDFVTSPAFEVNGNFSATSRLTVPAGEWYSGSVYTCQVSRKEDIQSRNITRPGSSSCDGPVITFLQPSQEQVLLEAKVTLTCVVTDAPYGVNVSWTREQQTLKSEIAVKPGEDPDSVISNIDISTQDWLSGDLFYCVVRHQDLPTPVRNSIYKKKAEDPREPFVSVLLPAAEEVSAQGFMTLTCLVRGFSPREIFVKWTINNKPVNSSNYKNTEVMAENGNSSFFMYSLLSVAAEEWTRGTSYSCVVGHEAIPLKISNRTVNKSTDDSDHIRIEDYEEESGNIWTTASTFIILFFLSIFYSAAVTLVKVK